MNILVFGAGVIGTLYAWQLSEAGHNVSLLVRPGRKQNLESKGIPISCIDSRAKKAIHIQTVYHPHLVEEFSPADGYELILVCVKRNQLNEVLPTLAQQSGNADILFLQNNWSGRAEIERYLAPSRYLLGFPSAGGSRDQQGMQCVLEADTSLGEIDGQITPRLRRIAAVMREAGFKPELSRQIIPWLWAHYATVAAMVGGLCKAGSSQVLAGSSPILKETLFAVREALAVCRARGIQLWRLPEIFIGYLPAWILVPFMKRRMKRRLPTEIALPILAGHVAHAADEMRIMYEDVLKEGERLGVAMPHFQGFQAYVERVDAVPSAG